MPTQTDRTPTERIAREVIEGLQVELYQLIRLHNDNNRAAWEMAAQKADEIRRVCLTVADAIQSRPLIQQPAANMQPILDAVLQMVRPA